MTGQENSYRVILDKYIESLDNDNEDRALIKRLETLSNSFREARDCYEEALIAQTLYYENLISQNEQAIVSSLVSAFQENKKKEMQYNSIYDYFNSLIQNNDLSWERIIKDINMSPRFIELFKSGKMHLLRIKPEKLAQISKILKADPDQVLRLAYRWISEASKKAEPSSVISYREVSGILYAHKENEQKENKAREQNPALDYLYRLEQVLS